MTLTISTPWHRESFDRFLDERLPQLLAERIPLAGYSVQRTGEYTCAIRISVESSAGDIEAQYNNLPRPDEDGLFQLEGWQLVVLPIASDEHLEKATIQCVGEQLLEWAASRLGMAPADLPWDESLLRAWVPLDTWFSELLQERGSGLRSVEWLDDTSWLEKHTRLRQLWIPDRQKVFTPGQLGRTCPFETPEGPNIGRILVIALGAAVQGERLVILDHSPEASLGLSASMIPFLSHNDPNRLLMGANMMRQWMVPPDPEPALVQTGNEPGAPDFWCGRSLLTAYISWGPDTFEDAVVISESAARRLDYPYPVEPGDKLSSRHGAKGVVSRILPDSQMPHLSDGTPIELVYNFVSLHSRMDFGQVLEAVWGRVAHSEGEPVLAPPFHSPGEEELRERLRRCGLPEEGMVVLTEGPNGPELQQPSTVGWVYWGRLYHIARDKVKVSVTPTGCQRQAGLEYQALRQSAAFENLAEQFNTRAAAREDAASLADRVAAGPVQQAGPPSPGFLDLQRRLLVGGIRMELTGEQLEFAFSLPGEGSLTLASTVPHPWLRERPLTHIEKSEEIAEWPALVEANTRLDRMMASGAPQGLLRKATTDLEDRVRDLFARLLLPEHLDFDARVLFTGRAVAAPGGNLRIDQVGLGEEMSWTLFGPQLLREVSPEEVRLRSTKAAEALDKLMAQSWILVTRAPVESPAGILAFHPVRTGDRVIRLHPMVCGLLNADFDGDQVVVSLPVTAQAQKEAGERLSVAGHLARDPSLVGALLSLHEAKWGTALLALTPGGREELRTLAGIDMIGNQGILTKEEYLHTAQRLLAERGVTGALEVLEQLMRRGFEVVKESGASISPFLGHSLQFPAEPSGEGVEEWKDYGEELMERLLSNNDYSSPDLGPQLLAIKSGARGRFLTLARLIGFSGTTRDVYGQEVLLRHGFRSGMTAQELFALAPGAREGMASLVSAWEQLTSQSPENRALRSFHPLARAMRARHPGIVFARAAATGEKDPLTNLDSRLFVGLGPG